MTLSPSVRKSLPTTPPLESFYQDPHIRPVQLSPETLLRSQATTLYQKGIQGVYKQDPANRGRAERLLRIGKLLDDPSITFAGRQIAHLTKLGCIPAINCMGTAGSGKSQNAPIVAQIMKAAYPDKKVVFIDADNFHSEENVAVMSSGGTLTDSQRISFLLANRNHFESARTMGEIHIGCCSALGPKHRAALWNRYSLSGNDPKFCKASTEEGREHWEPQPKNLDLVIIFIDKSPARTLLEMNRAATEPGQHRLFRGKPHYAIATFENHSFLDGQFSTLRKPPPWCSLTLKVDNFRDKSGGYDRRRITAQLQSMLVGS